MTRFGEGAKHLGTVIIITGMMWYSLSASILYETSIVAAGIVIVGAVVYIIGMING